MPSNHNISSITHNQSGINTSYDAQRNDPPKYLAAASAISRETERIPHQHIESLPSGTSQAMRQSLQVNHPSMYGLASSMAEHNVSASMVMSQPQTNSTQLRYDPEIIVTQSHKYIDSNQVQVPSVKSPITAQLAKIEAILG